MWLKKKEKRSFYSFRSSTLSTDQLPHSEFDQIKQCEEKLNNSEESRSSLQKEFNGLKARLHIPSVVILIIYLFFFFFKLTFMHYDYALDTLPRSQQPEGETECRFCSSL